MRSTSCRLWVFIPISSAPWAQKSHDRLAAVLPVYFWEECPNLFSFCSLNLSYMDELLSGFHPLNMVKSWCFMLLLCCAVPLTAAPTRSSYLPGTGEYKAPSLLKGKFISLLFVVVYKALPSLNRSSWAYTFYLWVSPEICTVLCSFDLCSFNQSIFS